MSASENIDETPSGKLLHGIMATIAEFYSSNLSAEARKGLEQKARVGGTVGLAPIGYKNTAAEIEGREVRTVAVDLDRAQIVRWAFEEFATGEWTLSQMAEELASGSELAEPYAQLLSPDLAERIELERSAVVRRRFRTETDGGGSAPADPADLGESTSPAWSSPWKQRNPVSERQGSNVNLLVDVQVLQSNLFSPSYIPSYLATVLLKIN